MVDRIERNKDLVQELVESTATHVGAIATIITGAVAGVAREIGEIFTDGFEMREAARKAELDAERDRRITEDALSDLDDDAASDLEVVDDLDPADDPDELDAIEAEFTDEQAPALPAPEPASSPEPALDADRD